MNGFDKVQDGGERTTFATGAQREPAVGKGRYDLLPPEALIRLAKHYAAGALKYADRNWEKGLPLHSFIDSSFRHLIQFMAGDRSEDHLAAILWNVAGYVTTEQRIREGKLPEELRDVPWPDSLGEVASK
jgi:dATP/dGTP diphosphohydrolase